MTHLLDVARLAWIFNLEEHLDIEKERIYAAALLHDIGRHIQYLEGTPHQEAGVPIAVQILKDCGFTEEEQAEISEAIARHRDVSVRDTKTLAGLIYRGDKASRACFGCRAEKECDWSREKKNLLLKA
jgi:HD superfamily phosphodiesterase